MTAPATQRYIADLKKEIASPMWASFRLRSESWWRLHETNSPHPVADLFCRAFEITNRAKYRQYCKKFENNPAIMIANLFKTRQNHPLILDIIHMAQSMKSNNTNAEIN